MNCLYRFKNDPFTFTVIKSKSLLFLSQRTTGDKYALMNPSGWSNCTRNDAPTDQSRYP